MQRSVSGAVTGRARASPVASRPWQPTSRVWLVGYSSQPTSIVWWVGCSSQPTSRVWWVGCRRGGDGGRPGAPAVSTPQHRRPGYRLLLNTSSLACRYRRLQQHRDLRETVLFCPVLSSPIPLPSTRQPRAAQTINVWMLLMMLCGPSLYKSPW